MKRVIISVTNDLVTDQRVDRVCNTLTKMGFRVLLVGRKLGTSLPLKIRPYRMKRMRLIFNRGPVFYAEYNLRLFFFLLFRKANLIVSNDLDTLLAGYLASRVKGTDHVHDCHEYFRGVPELNGRSAPLKAWKAIEDHIFPKIKSVYAVNHSIADIYSKEYGNVVHVIRNVPFRKISGKTINKADLGIMPGRKIILYQGAINVDRGLDEAILAMKYMTIPVCLLIIGTGDVIENLKNIARKENLSERVIFTGPVPFEELHSYTRLADIGLSIEKDVSLNYHFCLPNKFLDYIQALIPVLTSPLPEMKKIIDQYGIGEVIESHEPRYLASKFTSMLSSSVKLAFYRKNLEQASKDLCWENEEDKLISIYKPYV